MAVQRGGAAAHQGRGQGPVLPPALLVTLAAHNVKDYTECTRYTLFYEAEETGVPPMRPLWYEFPGDAASLDREGTHMVGGSLLVTPVTTQVMRRTGPISDMSA